MYIVIQVKCENTFDNDSDINTMTQQCMWESIHQQSFKIQLVTTWCLLTASIVTHYMHDDDSIVAAQVDSLLATTTNRNNSNRVNNFQPIWWQKLSYVVILVNVFEANCIGTNPITPKIAAHLSFRVFTASSHLIRRSLPIMTFI